eukprot:SAG31_NODE_5231_length_2659_cov_37.454297_4_plen_152_part_01
MISRHASAHRISITARAPRGQVARHPSSAPRHAPSATAQSYMTQAAADADRRKRAAAASRRLYHKRKLAADGLAAAVSACVAEWFANPRASLRPRTRPIPKLKGERPAVLGAVGSAAVTLEPPRQRVEPRRRRVPPVRLRPRREARLRLLLR